MAKNEKSRASTGLRGGFAAPVQRHFERPKPFGLLVGVGAVGVRAMQAPTIEGVRKHDGFQAQIAQAGIPIHFDA
jgi:hypothetical protein